jgi:hypothetical protein
VRERELAEKKKKEKEKIVITAPKPTDHKRSEKKQGCC